MPQFDGEAVVVIVDVFPVVVIVAGTAMAAVGAGSVGGFVRGRCPTAEVEHVGRQEGVDLTRWGRVQATGIADRVVGDRIGGGIGMVRDVRTADVRVGRAKGRNR